MPMTGILLVLLYLPWLGLGLDLAPALALERRRRDRAPRNDESEGLERLSSILGERFPPPKSFEEKRQQAYYDSPDNSLESLEAFDHQLNKTVVLARGQENPSPVLLGKIGLMYWERETRWLLGGLRESLKYLSEAQEQTPWEERDAKFAWTLQRGVVEARLGLQTEAMDRFELALNLSDATGGMDRATVLYHYGSTVLEAGGDKAATRARAFFNESLRLDPCSAEAPLARLRLVQAFALLPDIMRDQLGGWREMIYFLEGEAVLEGQGRCEREVALDVNLQQSVSPGIPLSPSQALVHWALFTAEDALGEEPQRAWTHLQKAIALDRQRAPGSTLQIMLEQSRLLLQRTEEHFQPGFWPPPEAKIGLRSRIPTFIVGFPRSGSTLLESMLDAHPSVVGIGESELLSFQVQRLEHELGELTAAANAGKVAFEPAYRRLINKHASAAQSAMQARVQDAPPHKHTKRPKRIVDKMLGNYKNIALILLLFPEATIIHTTRGPMDTLFSCLKNRFSDASMLYTLDPAALAGEYAMYRRFMRHYRTALPPGRIIEVQYEDLTCSPEATLRRVLKAMKLPWEESVLRFFESQRIVRTSSFLQVKQRLYTSSIGAWERYETQLQPLVRLLGELADLSSEELGTRASVPCPSN